MDYPGGFQTALVSSRVRVMEEVMTFTSPQSSRVGYFRAYLQV